MVASNGNKTVTHHGGPPDVREEFVALGKALHAELKDMVGQSEANTLVRLGKALERECGGMIDAAVGKAVKALEERFEKKLAALEKYYELGMDSIHALVKGLPTPVINVAAPNVHLPSGAIEVKMLPPVVNVSPEVRLTGKALEVTVAAPPPRKKKCVKTILYDQQTGRPAKVEEEESEV